MTVRHLAVRLHRAALGLLPSPTRTRLGAQLAAVFDEQVQEAQRRQGAPGVVARHRA